MSTVLVVIDLQERLAPHIHGIEDIVKNSKKIIQFCKLAKIPIVVTEQRKLGPTIEDIKNSLGDFEPIEKVTFSCWGAEDFRRAIEGFDRCVLIGIETHICVLQTALDLLDEGYEVQVALDCTGSRKEYDKEVAVRRMELAGVIPTTAETFIYEYARSADVDYFKEMLRIVKEG